MGLRMNEELDMRARDYMFVCPQHCTVLRPSICFEINTVFVLTHLTLNSKPRYVSAYRIPHSDTRRS